MLQKYNFENPEKKPLHELVFVVKEDGVQLKFSALSEHWVQPRCYTKYKKLPLNYDGGVEGDSASLDEWLNEAQWFNKDLEFLLSLEHFRFWSYIVYEKHCMEIIVCFLQEAIPYYIPLTSITTNANVIIMYTEILQNILRIICRIITNKESEEAWITKDHLKELLYTKFLISIPMIFDMIIAYGRTNLSILSKIVKTVFKINPKYNEDLKLAIQFLQNALTVIRKKTEGVDEEENENVSSLDDLALYTLDCASTLSILLEIYPDARIICSELQLELSITKFYDNTIPLLYKNIYTINEFSKSLQYLNQARIELVKAFRAIVYLHIENILKEPENSLMPAESFIAILTECLADRTFVIDYQRCYPVENDVDILKQACKELDSFKTDFVLKAYTNEGESYLVDFVEKNVSDESEENLITESEDKIQKSVGEIFENGIEGAARDIAIEVSYVQDVLPYLGDGFIRRLLSRYDNPEQAISAILENNLPPDLENADQNEIYIPADPRDTFEAQTGIKRYNIFDGDEYDILTNDKPNCVIKSKKGFPGQAKNVKQLLDDKSYVKEMKERYQQYSMVEYEDEYDDSYDAFADSEAKTTKSKAIKEVISNEVEDSVSEEDEEENNYDNGDNENNRGQDDLDGRDRSKDFCENPENIRARYEASRNAKFANRSNRMNSQKSSTDVVGKSKGQGQEKDVIISRQKKEAHKSSRANHNRKSGSSWKRSRGMIPS